MTNGVVRLDGGLATELRRAGLSVDAPWWTTKALLTGPRRDLLRELHERYLSAGAQVITANTFRCNLRALQANGLDAAGLAWMVHAAVGMAQAARHAVGTPDVLIAGSVAPVEDCYTPDAVPSDDELRTEHRWLAVELSRAGVDLVLIETMNSVREARIALEEVLATGAKAWVSFVCRDGASVLSGESLAGAVRAVEGDGASAVLVNCTPVEHTRLALTVLAENCSGVFGVYPNVEDRSDIPQWTHVDRALPSTLEPAAFGELLDGWHGEFGAGVLGGCCGSTPAHIAALQEAGLARTG